MLMTKLIAEFVGTMILIYLGDGVCANCTLTKSKGQNSGWIVITAGWAFAVGIPAYIFGGVSGAHFNPALTIALAVIGKFPASEVFPYICAQMLGAFAGAVLVWLSYLPHWEQTEDKAAKLGIFCTAPAIRNLPANFITEFLGTATLVFGILGIGIQHTAAGFGTLFVTFIIWSLGLSAGGPTGYAINPARDLGPRIAHAVLPIAGKGDSDWSYALIPVLGPIAGGIVGALVFTLIF